MNFNEPENYDIEKPTPNTQELLQKNSIRTTMTPQRSRIQMPEVQKMEMKHYDSLDRLNGGRIKEGKH